MGIHDPLVNDTLQLTKDSGSLVPEFNTENMYHLNNFTTNLLDNNSMESSEMALFHYITNVYIDGFLCLMGIAGNLMILLVLWKEKSKTSNSVLLQGLAVFDLCFLLYVILYVVMRSINVYTGNLDWMTAANPYIVAFVLPFGWTSQTGTIWMVMAIAIDRYLIVSQPLKSVDWCTVKNARKATMCIAAAAIMFNAPRWPRYYFMAFTEQNSSNSTFVSHQEASSVNGWNDDLYRIIYHIVLTLFFLFLIPLTAVIILNCRLIHHVKKANKQRLSLTNNQHQKTGNQSLNITKMMVIMITVFIICELPDVIASIIGAGQFKINQTIYEYYAGVKEALLVFNSAINFYLYCIFFTKFRNTLSHICGCVTGLGKQSMLDGSMCTTTTGMTGSIQSLTPHANGAKKANDQEPTRV